MNKPGDICMIFGSPIKMECPIDQAKLIEKKGDVGNLEEWWVEYLNDPEQQYIALIKKSEDGKNKI